MGIFLANLPELIAILSTFAAGVAIGRVSKRIV
jgi:hypothetical protein